jgi:cytochrome c oxidase subunit 2
MNGSDTPLAYLHTAGPAADPVTRLGWGLALVSIAVVIIIGALLVVAIFRKRRAATDPSSGDALMPLRERAGLRWIYVGTGISAVVLFACAVWTLFTLAAIAAPGTKPRVVVEVRAFQFWWRVRYLDANGAVLLTTANEIHIPVGEPVRFQLTSGDVIHSFWVPSLGGKMDVLPGQTNVTWLQGDTVGRYRGQCGEFCGAEHAHMALFVDVDPPAAFEQWVARQRSPAVPAADAAAGARVFVDKCAGCHAVRGTDAKGESGPDLTHLMSRRTIAAGTLPNSAADLERWISQTQTVKPGSEMPVVPLTATESSAVVAYLQTLH